MREKKHAVFIVFADDPPYAVCYRRIVELQLQRRDLHNSFVIFEIDSTAQMFAHKCVHLCTLCMNACRRGVLCAYAHAVSLCVIATPTPVAYCQLTSDHVYRHACMLGGCAGDLLVFNRLHTLHGGCWRLLAVLHLLFHCLSLR